MKALFFEYCGIDVERPTSETLVVRRTRPSIALLLIVLLPLPMFGLFIVRAQLRVPQVVFLSLLLAAFIAYCIQSYRSIQPRTWTFDKERREARIDGDLIYPFERLIRVELDQHKVNRGRNVYTLFVLTLCWMAGPERAFASRRGSQLGALAMEIADYVGVPLLHTAEGRELQTLEAGFGGRS